MKKIVFDRNKSKDSNHNNRAINFVAASLILFESIFGCATVRQETNFEQKLRTGEIYKEISQLEKEREKASGSRLSEINSQLLNICNEAKVNFKALSDEVNACDALKRTTELDDEVKAIIEKECKKDDLNKKIEKINILDDLVKKCDELLLNILHY